MHSLCILAMLNRYEFLMEEFRSRLMLRFISRALHAPSLNRISNLASAIHVLEARHGSGRLLRLRAWLDTRVFALKEY